MEDNFKVPSSLNILKKNVYRKCKTEIRKSDTDAQQEFIKSSSTIANHKCTYIEPKWSQKPSSEYNYSFEVIKDGVIVDNIKSLQTRSYWLIGKLTDNDITLAHPTISRYHAILQYRPQLKSKNDKENGPGDGGGGGSSSSSDDEDEQKKDDKLKNKSNNDVDIEKGWYLYDLNSTHGSFINKMRIPPEIYVRIRVGYILKFGCSTRNFILQGPEFDEEARLDITITEMKELKRNKELARLEQLELQEKHREAEGISWGMVEDADEETDLSINPYATTNNEDLFIQDPKKTLRGFFEREGLELDYKVDEMSLGTFVCRVELPIDDTNGRPIVAEVCHKGKKKDCVLQCALEACRILDRHGVLRQANHEPLKRKKAQSDSDDDDEFWDRTGAVERRRQKKMANNQNNALTYEELLEQEKQLLQKLMELNENIENYQKREAKLKLEASMETDDLDDFVANLSNDKNFDKTEIRKLRVQEQELKTDHNKLLRLINIARPVELPPIQNVTENKKDISLEEKRKRFLPMFGKRDFKKRFLPKSLPFPESSSSLPLPSATTPPSSSSTTKTSVSALSTSINEEIEEFDDIEIETKENEDDKIDTNDLKYPENELKMDIASDELKSQNVEKKYTDHQENNVNENDDNDDKDHNAVDNDNNEETIDDNNEKQEIISDTTTTTLSKKRRNRIRIRNRENVDINDTNDIYDTEKYSEWIPPENQSGDGLTNLNSKYGY